MELTLSLEIISGACGHMMRDQDVNESMTAVHLAAI